MHRSEGVPPAVDRSGIEAPTGGARTKGATTMTELPLWMTDAPHSGSRTSRDAAADIKPHVARLRARVLAFIATRGSAGCTREEIERGTGLAGNTVRPRVVELLEHGAVRVSGHRANDRGRKVEVLEMVP